MASAFGHAVVSATFTHLGQRSKTPLKVWLYSIVLGILPDADSIGFKLGIPYSSIYGHRGLTHSLFFSLGIAMLATGIVFSRSSQKLRIFFILFASAASHGLIDAMTNGGMGVGFFIPFDNTRYFLPFRPIEVSPISISHFFDQAQRILVNEFYWLGVPCITLIAALSIIKRAKKILQIS